MNGIQPGHPPPATTMQMKGPNGAMGRAPDNGDRMNKNKRQLNTAIYDYFLKMGMYDLCRQLKQSGAPLELDDGKNGQKQEDDMQEGSDRPQDLPLPHIRWRSMGVDTAILLDWFSIFWDMWMVGANPNKMKQENPMALEYHTLLANQNKAQHNQQQLLMQRVGPMGPQMAMMRNQRLAAGMVPNVQQQQLQMIKRHQAMQQQANMGRDGAGMDGDGQQPRTPGSGDNMPSPSKRQRIDGNPQFGPTGQMMQNGQGQQLEMRNMLQANGIHHQLTPNQITSLQSANQQVRNKSIELYGKIHSGAHDQQRANMVGSPVVPPGVDQQMMGGPGSEYYNPRQLGGQANGHALQDYQMQLMLLERQNRKRLEMAKQEQHNIPVDGQPASGGSPMPDGMQRPSPSAMNYNGQMPGGMDKGMSMMPNGVRAGNPNFPNGMNPGMMPGAQPGGGPNQPQMNGANFPQGQQGPMGPGGQQGPQPMGTPQQRNQNMPPPPGMPPSNQHATGRAPSPAPSAATSTPQQSKAANPKKKNETKKDRKPSKAQQKAAAAAATPAENQDNAPTTSTPATPMTPAMVNPNNKGGASANQGNGQNPSGPGQNNGGPGGPPGHQGDPNDAAAQNAANASASDPSFGIGLDEMDMTFGNVDAADVLENFNFDSYIEDPPQDFSIQGLDFGAFDNEGVGA